MNSSFGLRSTIRRLSRRFASQALFPFWRAKLSAVGGDKALVLMYHRVLPVGLASAESVQPGMYVTPETLRMHLREIKRSFFVSSLREWSAGIKADTRRPVCIVTFDDGWADNLHFALPILQEERVPATIFVVTSMIGTRRRFWQDVVIEILQNRGNAIPERLWSLAVFDPMRTCPSSVAYRSNPFYPEHIVGIVSELRQYSDQAMWIAIERIVEVKEFSTVSLQASNNSRLLNWDEVRTLRQSGLIDIGSHTANHIRLNEMTGSVDAERELSTANAELAAHDATSGERVPFCYPNGEMWQAAEFLVRQHHSCAVTTKPGWNDRGSDIYSLRRVGLHDDATATPAEFTGRIVRYL